jgi:gliding-associated putative ABC transporter substrate-binding component GldG
MPEFVGTIDTVKAAGIRKTPLMYTSQYTRVLPAPVEISLNQAGLDMNPALFTRGKLPVAYLLEGRFRSLVCQPHYRFRSHARLPLKKQVFLPKSLYVADGDLPANEINPQNGRFMPLGYDRYSKNTFANKDFVVHAIDYLMDENGIIAARNKEIALRPLDKLRIRKKKAPVAGINLVLAGTDDWYLWPGAGIPAEKKICYTLLKAGSADCRKNLSSPLLQYYYRKYYI